MLLLLLLVGETRQDGERIWIEGPAGFPIEAQLVKPDLGDKSVAKRKEGKDFIKTFFILAHPFLLLRQLGKLEKKQERTRNKKRIKNGVGETQMQNESRKRNRWYTNDGEDQKGGRGREEGFAKTRTLCVRQHTHSRPRPNPNESSCCPSRYPSASSVS